VPDFQRLWQFLRPNSIDVASRAGAAIMRSVRILVTANLNQDISKLHRRQCLSNRRYRKALRDVPDVSKISHALTVSMR